MLPETIADCRRYLAADYQPDPVHLVRVVLNPKTYALNLMTRALITVFLLAGLSHNVAAQEKLASLLFEEYEPVSTLVVDAHLIEKAKYPFIDVHSHHFQADTYDDARLAEVIQDMDGLNMSIAVNLSGGTGDKLESMVESMKGRYPNRFVVFANIDFENVGESGWTERTVAQLEEDVANGAQGLKIYKSLGLRIVDQTGKRLSTNDPRLDPIWAKAGKLGIPVLIHTGEPSPFWSDRDRFNERWLELKQYPNRYRDPDENPPWAEIMAEQHDVFRKHPGTNFINAHLGWYGNDLGGLGKLMDVLPNMYTEVGAVLAELGRQPRTARSFLIKYKDRVMFGKDSWAPDEYRIYFRTFETADEFFDYYRKRHAHWKLYGLDLPDEVLRHIYYRNAIRIIPGIDASKFPD